MHSQIIQKSIQKVKSVNWIECIINSDTDTNAGIENHKKNQIMNQTSAKSFSYRIKSKIIDSINVNSINIVWISFEMDWALKKQQYCQSIERKTPIFILNFINK